MRITPRDVDGTYKQGTLYGTPKEKLVRCLGEPNIGASADGKVEWAWGFEVEIGDESYTCAIWDWKGSEEYNEWSFFGPSDIIHLALEE